MSETNVETNCLDIIEQLRYDRDKYIGMWRSQCTIAEEVMKERDRLTAELTEAREEAAKAHLAGAAAQRKRDVEIAKTEHPKHLVWYPKGYSLDPNKINYLYKYAAAEIAAAIDRQEVEG